MAGPWRAAARPPIATAVALVIVPGLALAYVGLQSIGEREAGLRRNYAATTVLVRDRVAAELTRLEMQFGAELAQLKAASGEPTALRRWLADQSRIRPWLDTPFVVTRDAVVTARLSSRRVSLPPSDAEFDRLPASFLQAEAAEFRTGDLAQALASYRQARSAASTDAVRALAQARIARTLFKLHRLDESLAAYRSLCDVDPAIVDPNGIPFGFVARSQMTELLAALGRAAERDEAARDSLRFALENPWDADRGYGYYLRRAAEAVKTREGTLEALADLGWLESEIVPRLAVVRSSDSGTPAHARLLASRDEQPVILGWQRLTDMSNDAVVVGYAVQPAFVAGKLLDDVLAGVDIGADLRLAVVSTDQDGGAAGAASPALATADLDDVLPGWAVVLVDGEGRSVEQLVARERAVYGTLIGGMLIVLVAGVFFSARASSREAELARLRTEFVANVSHELKTPLALIRMFGETLESGIVDDPQKREEFSAIIRRESERLTFLINNVLDAARIDAGTKQYSFADGDLVGVVRQAVDTYRPFFDRLGFHLHVSLPPSPVLASIDPDALAQMLVNLFQNAIKYSAAEKVVSVSLECDETSARLSVADRGIGIPANHVPRIFDKYYRVAGHGEVAGSGLGLAIVRHAMEAHCGQVEVESRVGHGTTLTLIFPCRKS